MKKLGDIDFSKETIKAELSLCKPSKEIISILNTAYDISFDESLGALNSLEFKLPFFIDKHHQIVRNDVVDIIKGRYIVYLELGNHREYFIINQIDKVGNGNTEHVEVSCLSLAYELNDTILRDLELVSENCSSILKILLKDTIWKIGYVDSEFDLINRSFNVSSSNVFEAISDLSKTFNALIKYDSIKREVSMIRPELSGIDRGFSVSYEKYLDSMNEEDNSEEVITRLKMYGNENISIQEVVPSGQPYIEDFSYFVYPYKENVQKVEEVISGSDIFNNWSKVGFSSNYNIDGNGIKMQSTTTVSSRCVSLNSYKNIVAKFSVLNSMNNTGGNYGFVFNYIDSNNYYYFTHEKTIGNNISLKLYKVENGSTVIVAQDEKNIKSWSTGITYNVTVEILNKNIFIKIDEKSALSYNARSNFEGKIGFINKSNITSFKNISVRNIDIQVLSRSEYLSDELCHLINRYEELLKSSEGEFNNLVGYRTVYNSQMSDLRDVDLAKLNIDYKKLLDERDILNTRIAKSSDSINNADNNGNPTDFLQNTLSSLVSQRDSKLVEISNKEHEIKLKEDEIAVVQSLFDGIEHKINEYRLKISLESNFPQPYLDERIQHTITKEWQDNNIIDPEALLKEGIKVFEEFRQQKITVTVDIVDFRNMISEQKNWDKLVLGDLFDIEHSRMRASYKAKIIGINHDIEGKKIKVTISNVKDIFSNKSKFLDLLNKTNKISSSISMKEWEWDLSLENKGSINEIINNFWDANKQAIIGAKDQVIEISDRGLIIRDENDPNVYLVGINGMIAITNDGGATFKHAITSEGIVGERVYGKIIMGVNLAIEDESGILIIQGSRGKVFNREGDLRLLFGLVEEDSPCGEAFGLISVNEITQVKLTDCEGFVISRKNTSEADYPDGWEKVFWTTPNGTIFAHDIVVSNIKIVQNKEWDKLIMDSELGFFDLGFFSKIVKDGKLTTDEKLQLITELIKIGSSYMTVKKQADKYMYVSRDDNINFNQAFDTYTNDFPRGKSQEAKIDLTNLKRVYLELINFMSSYIKVNSSNPHEPLSIQVEHEMTETTSDLGNNRQRLILLFKDYYDEYDKVSDNIEDVIVYQGISMGNNYNNVFIGEHGVVVVRSDGMYRAYLNATNGLALEKWENGVWVKKLYGAIGDSMWEDGTLIAEGLVAKSLKIVDGNLGERIKLDWYSGITISGDRGYIYLNAQEGIKITDLGGDAKFWVDMDGNLFAKDITCENLYVINGWLGEDIILDEIDGIIINGENGEQIRINTKEGFAIDINGEPRLWLSMDGYIYARKLIIIGDGEEAPLEDIDGSFISDLTVNKLKTLDNSGNNDIIHIEKNFINLKTRSGSDEQVKMQITFDGSGTSAYPVMVFGAGNGSGYGSGSEQAKIFKNSDRFAIEYDNPNGIMSKFYFNHTDSDDEGQAVYFESKGGVRFHSDKKFVAKVEMEQYMRVVKNEDVTLKYKDSLIRINNEGIELRYNTSNYIKLTSSGIEIKGTKISLN